MSSPEESRPDFSYPSVSQADLSSHFRGLQITSGGLPELPLSPIPSHTNTLGYPFSDDTTESQGMIVGFHTKLSDSQRTAEGRKNSLEETIKLLREDLATQDTKSSVFPADHFLTSLP